jgi:hypothetical protein
MCLNCENNYYAGFFDGEGHVMIRDFHPEKGRRGSMSLVVTVGQVDVRPLERAKERWGGRLYTESNPKRKKILNRWQIGSRSASQFLADIFPYLVVKKDQVAFALEFQDTVTNKSAFRLSEAEVTERFRLRDAIRALNGRQYFGKRSKLRAVGGGCLNCGCGIFHDNHGDPMNITRSRLSLIASHNDSTMREQAKNILATLLGYIDEKNPLKDDKIEINVKRIKVKPETEVKYVERKRTKGTAKES